MPSESGQSIFGSFGQAGTKLIVLHGKRLGGVKRSGVELELWTETRCDRSGAWESCFSP